jgi:hypothetical protein
MPAFVKANALTYVATPCNIARKAMDATITIRSSFFEVIVPRSDGAFVFPNTESTTIFSGQGITQVTTAFTIAKIRPTIILPLELDIKSAIIDTLGTLCSPKSFELTKDCI